MELTEDLEKGVHDMCDFLEFAKEKDEIKTRRNIYGLYLRGVAVDDIVAGLRLSIEYVKDVLNTEPNEIRSLYLNGIDKSQIMRLYGITDKQVNDVLNGVDTPTKPTDGYKERFRRFGIASRNALRA